MSFDCELTEVISATLGIPTPEALEAGQPALVEMGIGTGLRLPLANPQTGEPLVVPSGRFRFSFPREQAIEIFEQALEKARELPEQPTASGRVMVAQNMADVSRVASGISQFT